jgi:hypothetical protein
MLFVDVQRSSIRRLTMRTEDAPFSEELQATLNVDALVNENENEQVRTTPGTPLSSHFFEQPRRATPSVPPGFTAPAIPRAMVEESLSRPGSRPMSRTTSSNIVPAVPVVPVTPIKATPTKSKKSKQPANVVEASTATAPTTTKQIPETPTKATNKNPSVPQWPAPEASKAALENVENQKKQDNKEKKASPETPTKATAKVKTTSKKGDKNPVVVDTPRKQSQKDIDAVAPTATPTSTSKRQPPGKLDIPAATKMTGNEPLSTANSLKMEQTKNVHTLPATSNGSVPASPAATGSPIKRSVAPRTLRVVPTSKAEVPPALSAASVSSLPHIPTVDKLRSRQASIASLNQPGTPASEMISDTASITSGMISRAGSPPIGGKVGTAPVRKKTKSQAKKDRQERKRQIEEEQTTGIEDKSDVEVIQAPIVGRKKKTKKPSSNPKPAAVAAKSRPASPKPPMVEEEQVETPVAAPVKVQSVHNSATATPEPEPIPEEPKEKREYTAQAIIGDLQKTGELITSTLEFFKPLSSTLTHSSRTVPLGTPSAPPDLKIHFSEADLEALAKKKPVRLGDQDGRPDSRTLITPSGKFFWGLSQELEEKALQLEKNIEEIRGNARFHPRKQVPYAYTHNMSAQAQPSDVLPAIATALKEAGKKLGNNSGHQMPKFDPFSGLLGSTPLPSVHAPEVSSPQPPPPPQPQTPADAGSYLNQFVLPKTDNPPPNQPRPEMAAVGGPPGSGTSHISVNAGKFAKAAKAVIEGGAVGSTEIDGMGVMAADLLGGVFVQGLEALVGAGLGFHTGDTDGNGGAIGYGTGSLDVQGLVSAIESSGVGSGFSARSRARGSVLGLDEAEQAMLAARKEHEVLEKKLAAMMKKNKKVVGLKG